jgi:multimeric flavodoxin WrbA
MRAIIISGSRNPAGQTARTAEALRKGIESGGGQVETVFLPPLKVERCRQCDDNGWGLCRREGRCVIADDFAGLTGKVRDADVAVFATPVYYSDLSESLRAFLDRLRRTCAHEAGRTGIEGTRSVGVCVAGGGGGGAPACCAGLEKILTTCKLDVVDMVPVRRQNLEAKLSALEHTGLSLAGGPGREEH